MKLSIQRAVRAAMVGVAIATASATFAAGEGGTPFKLGTFQANGREFVGLVLQDSRVLDVAAANAAFEKRNRKVAKVRAPADMKELIARYEQDVGPRLRELAAANAGSTASTGAGSKLSFEYSIASLKVLPPVRPAVILNAGANYPEHLQGIVEQGARSAAAAAAQSATAPGASPTTTPSGAPPSGMRSPGAAPGAGAQPNGAPSSANPGGAPPNAAPPNANAGRPPTTSAPGLWERAPNDSRPDNPYLFLKSPSVVVGANDDVVVPKGRDQIDWECEFALVIGRPAKNVSVADAPGYVFGYSIEFDVSDRGGRNDRKMGGGPDWFVQKNHDTFAPIGPFIVPKEFVPNPMNTRHYFTLNGEIKQDSNTSRMEYNIWEMLSYGSNVLTLNPGDMLSAGTPSGTNIEKNAPRWMKPGDVGVCVVEGIGEQRHNIVAQK